MRNDQPIEQPTDLSTLTKRYTEEAVRFIQQNRKKPFFLYFAHTYPHVPLFASKQFQKTSPRGLYGDVVEELDWSVGQVLDTLRKEGLAKNTLVFFTSDNGPWLVKDLAGGSPGLLAGRQRQHLGRRHARAGHRLVAGQDQGRRRQSRDGLLDGPVHHLPDAGQGAHPLRPHH